MLQDAAEGPDGLDIGRRPYRAFSFGHEQIVIDASSRLTVITGFNSAGEEVFQIQPQARPSPLSARAGYLVPPDSAWEYNTDGGFTHYEQHCDFFGNNCQNVWKRNVYYLVNVAWNYGGYTYWRLYGRMQAQVLTGAPYNPVWGRAALELNWTNWGGNPTDNFGEFAEPNDDIPGAINTTKTIGFASGLNYVLGKAPFQIGGSIDSTYQGSVQTASEWWKPIVRPDVGDGGVQFCRYGSSAQMNRKVATRTSIRQNVGGALGYWTFIDSMAETSAACPPE